MPGAEVRWRYRRVLAGLAVVVPRGAEAVLERLPGVVAVYPSVRYHALREATPAQIGAPALWGPDLAGSAGRGLKIGIIDDGVDPSHPFFDPAGFTAPPGFPRGDRRYTSAKVIVARAFAPPDAGWRNAGKPFDPVYSSHGSHVAGIAAGNFRTRAPGVGRGSPLELSGVAPLAFIGNYKALTVPTDSGLGLNGNSPELVAAIEAAVEDGMDVINLSLGQPEVPPERDAVAKALDNAAAAGVVPVVAAGNEGADFGAGSISSPGTSAGAITVAAAAIPRGVVASFSSTGPTSLGLALKPDVSAPGVDVVSAAPKKRFEAMSGTSMATPHVAGAAALLRERHPDWTVAQIKSALVTTGRPVRTAPDAAEARASREGGGLVDLSAADAPLLFASPQGLAFGFLDVSAGRREVARAIELTDAGNGSGRWDVAVVEQRPGGGATVVAAPAVDVPGTLVVTAGAAADAKEREHTGFVVLTRDGQSRRVPFWFRVTRPRLREEAAKRLHRAGTYRATTLGRPALVDRYRYPEPPAQVRRFLPGPERVFRFVLERPVANFGVAVVQRAPGVIVEPRIVAGRDENRLAAAPALPFVNNPYLLSFSRAAPIAAALLPTPGEYSIVFDSPSLRAAGPFAFRFWVNDVTPPKIALLSRRGRTLTARVTDAGSGVDPKGVLYAVDGGELLTAEYDPRTHVATLDLADVKAGRHRLELRASDRQEAKNTENVPRILPNTRVLRTLVTVPRE